MNGAGRPAGSAGVRNRPAGAAGVTPGVRRAGWIVPDGGRADEGAADAAAVGRKARLWLPDGTPVGRITRRSQNQHTKPAPVPFSESHWNHIHLASAGVCSGWSRRAAEWSCSYRSDSEMDGRP